MNPEDLIRIARGLASGAISGTVGRPRQAELRRAVSAAYYALFHALARCCADTLVGATPASRSQSAWTQTYRALEHGYARNQCRRPLINGFPPEIREFGRAFAYMQRHRNIADYATESDLSRAETMGLVNWTKEVIDDFAAAPVQDRRAFSVYVLMRMRVD